MPEALLALPKTSSLKRSIPLSFYMRDIEATDVIPLNDLQTIIMGLFGEVGSLMSATKKYRREKGAFPGFQKVAEEEFGDALWYLTAICRRLNISLDTIFSEALSGGQYEKLIAASDIIDGPVSHVTYPSGLQPLNETLLALAEAATALFKIGTGNQQNLPLLQNFAHHYMHSLHVAKITFADVVHMNLEKARGRFLEPDMATLPDFDSKFDKEEQLPRHFEMVISQRKNGRSYMQWNGVFVGDPLSDNILDKDGYRFHDVFHFAHAAILHWSPTFRALIKHKRKSDPIVDEAQDGGRAIVVEEGLTAWIFARAKELHFFDGQDGVSFDILKTIAQFVQGYEVEECPLKLWERAILDGYSVFRQVKANNGGIVVGDREARTISYRPLEEAKS